MMQSSPHSTQRNVLVTGVSSGIGLGMTRKFLAEGYTVFGSVRSNEKAEKLRKTLGDRFVPLVFDISSEAQVEKSAVDVVNALNGGGLAALINNAGSAEIGPLLHVPPEDFTRQLDTLVVGQLRVIQAFHPLLLPGSKTPGRIINISSVSGTGWNYFFGAYASGKHALEGLSKTLREELRAQGIAVIVVAPGDIATDIWPKQTTDLIEKYRGTEYYDALESSVRTIQSHTAKGGMSVNEFSNALFEIFEKPKPADRYTVIKARLLKGRLARLTPARVRVIEE